MPVVNSDELDAFVQTSDRLGGPGSSATRDYWKDFRYLPRVQVDTRLDPDAGVYMEQMLALYREMSGRTMDLATNELLSFDVQSLVHAYSPYASRPPGELALHYLRLAKIIRGAGLPLGARILDLGCGWGLSSEFLAQLGFQVHAVDLNPQFVALVQQRTRRLNLDVKVERALFEQVEPAAQSVDAALFYESFHHAPDPRPIVRNIAHGLKPGGCLMLAGEPIQEEFWPAWGLRLDALSVYCIRKFGWFESGFSRAYLARLLARHGLLPWFVQDLDPQIGLYAYGIKTRRATLDVLSSWGPEPQWWKEFEWLVSNRDGEASSLTLYRPASCHRVVFELMNFSPDPMPLQLAVAGSRSEHLLLTGRNEVSAPLDTEDVEVVVRFTTKSWCPAEVLGTGDHRRLGFHLAGATFA